MMLNFDMMWLFVHVDVEGIFQDRVTLKLDQRNQNRNYRKLSEIKEILCFSVAAILIYKACVTDKTYACDCDNHRISNIEHRITS